MIELRKHRKDMDFSSFDYVFEDMKKFEAVLPFLLPKLDGYWSIMLVEPKLSQIRTYLDTSLIPSYIKLTITVEPSQLEQLYLERPGLVEKEKTNWEIYLDLIQSYPTPMDDKAMREIYYRKGPKEEDLREALNELLEYPFITMQEVNRHFSPANKVFAIQVMRSFLLGQYKQAWRKLSKLDMELGSTITFFALRKSIRRIFEEKCRYMKNEEVNSRFVEIADGYTILLMYWLFENATSPDQLYPILLLFERRQFPC